MRSEKDRDKWREYPHADLFLLDAGRGSGNTFDWALAKDVEKPFLLAGGLNSENVEEAITQIQSTRYSEKGYPDKQSSFIGVDVSSGVENTGGGKNYSKMRLFIDKVRGKE
jgi:phosphoribosylanthranilate isomerase